MRFTEAAGEMRINRGCAGKAHFIFVREIHFRLYDCPPKPIVTELSKIEN